MWENFCPDFLSNLLATFLGLLGGIPLALWLNRINEDRTQKERERDIIAALKREMGVNRNKAQEKIAAVDAGKGVLALPGMKYEFYNMLINGGELKWVMRNSDFVQRVSTVFQTAKVINHLEVHYSETMGTFTDLEKAERVKSNLSGSIKNGCEKLIEQIDETLILEIFQKIKE
jgi:hypothetical protein